MQQTFWEDLEVGNLNFGFNSTDVSLETDMFASFHTNNEKRQY